MRVLEYLLTTVIALSLAIGVGVYATGQIKAAFAQGTAQLEAASH